MEQVMQMLAAAQRELLDAQREMRSVAATLARPIATGESALTAAGATAGAGSSSSGRSWSRSPDPLFPAMQHHHGPSTVADNSYALREICRFEHNALDLLRAASEALVKVVGEWNAYDTMLSAASNDAHNTLVVKSAEPAARPRDRSDGDIASLALFRWVAAAFGASNKRHESQLISINAVAEEIDQRTDALAQKYLSQQHRLAQVFEVQVTRRAASSAFRRWLLAASNRYRERHARVEKQKRGQQPPSIVPERLVDLTARSHSGTATVRAAFATWKMRLIARCATRVSAEVDALAAANTELRDQLFQRESHADSVEALCHAHEHALRGASESRDRLEAELHAVRGALADSRAALEEQTVVHEMAVRELTASHQAAIAELATQAHATFEQTLSRERIDAARELRELIELRRRDVSEMSNAHVMETRVLLQATLATSAELALRKLALLTDSVKIVAARKVEPSPANKQQQVLADLSSSTLSDSLLSEQRRAFETEIQAMRADAVEAAARLQNMDATNADLRRRVRELETQLEAQLEAHSRDRAASTAASAGAKVEASTGTDMEWGTWTQTWGDSTFGATNDFDRSAAARDRGDSFNWGTGTSVIPSPGGGGAVSPARVSHRGSVAVALSATAPAQRLLQTQRVMAAWRWWAHCRVLMRRVTALEAANRALRSDRVESTDRQLVELDSRISTMHTMIQQLTDENRSLRAAATGATLGNARHNSSLEGSPEGSAWRNLSPPSVHLGEGITNSPGASSLLLARQSPASVARARGSSFAFPADAPSRYVPRASSVDSDSDGSDPCVTRNSGLRGVVPAALAVPSNLPGQTVAEWHLQQQQQQQELQQRQPPHRHQALRSHEGEPLTPTSAAGGDDSLSAGPPSELLHTASGRATTSAKTGVSTENAAHNREVVELRDELERCRDHAAIELHAATSQRLRASATAIKFLLELRDAVADKNAAIAKAALWRWRGALQDRTLEACKRQIDLLGETVVESVAGRAFYTWRAFAAERAVRARDEQVKRLSDELRQWQAVNATLTLMLDERQDLLDELRRNFNRCASCATLRLENAALAETLVENVARAHYTVWRRFAERRVSERAVRRYAADSEKLQGELHALLRTISDVLRAERSPSRSGIDDRHSPRLMSARQQHWGGGRGLSRSPSPSPSPPMPLAPGTIRITNEEDKTDASGDDSTNVAAHHDADVLKSMVSFSQRVSRLRARCGSGTQLADSLRGEIDDIVARAEMLQSQLGQSRQSLLVSSGSSTPIAAPAGQTPLRPPPDPPSAAPIPCEALGVSPEVETALSVSIDEE